MAGTALLVGELVALLVGVAAALHLLERRVGAARLREWLGGRPLAAALKGIAVGFVTPFCTYSAVPLLIGLRRAGVPTAGWVAFIVAAPILDPVLFGALALIVGIEVAAAYAAVAFAAALTAALAAHAVDLGSRLPTMPAADGEPGSPAWRGLRAELPAAGREAARLLRSIGPLLLAGVTVGLAIEALVSPETAAGLTGRASALAIPAAAALGTPLYFHTELLVPVADSLRAAGVGAGALVALTIAGAGANVPEFVVLRRLATSRVIGVFAGYVFAVAVAGGVVAQLVAG